MDNLSISYLEEQSSKQLFISWVAFQRRNVSMKEYFDYQNIFNEFAFKNRLLRPLEYLFKSVKTIAIYIGEKPDTVWIQLPPSFLLHLTFLYKCLFNRSLIVVADCHNALFRKPWIKIPGTVSLLNRCDFVLVHNNAVKQDARNNKIRNSLIHVLEDPPASVESNVLTHQFTQPTLLFPCSFNKDEPIAELLAAARLVPELDFVITGNTHRAAGIHDLSKLPENVELAGYMSSTDFDELISNVDAILGLTYLDGIQLSVASEALGAGKPMVLSDTNTLRTLFYQGAVFVDSLSPDSIAKGCVEALANREKLKNEVKLLRAARMSKWLKQAGSLGPLLQGRQTQTTH